MKKYAERFSIVTGFLIAGLIFLSKWLYYDGISYTILGYFYALKKAGGIMTFAAAANNITMEEAATSALTANAYPAYAFLFLPLAAGVLSLLRSCLLLFHKKTWKLGVIICWLGFIYLASSLVFFFYMPTAGYWLAAFLVLLDALGCRYIVERSEIHKRARELKQKETAEKADKKRRMHFPGRYSREFYDVIWANFRSNFKSYTLFIISGTMSAALLFILFGMQTFLGSLHKKVDFLMGDRFLAIMKEFIPIVIFVSVMLFVLIISNYIKTRMENYGTFISLGIRKKTLWLIIALEYAACLLGSAAAGLSVGLIGLPALKALFIHTADLSAVVTVDYGRVALVTFIVYLLLVGLSTLINYHLFEHVDISASIVKSVEKEPFPRHLLTPGILLGAALIIRSVGRFRTGRWGEQTSLILWMLLGCLLLVYCGGSRLMQWYLKKPARYLKKLLEILPLRYRFRTNAKYFVLLLAVHIFAFAVFIPRLSASIITEPEKELLPYDFVCLAHEDDESFFRELDSKYSVQLNDYDMVRLNTILGEPYSWRQFFTPSMTGMVSPPGQHIGISESVYIQMKEALGAKNVKPLGLADQEIHIVYQQDTSQQAHPLDWYQNSEMPRLKAGAFTSYSYGSMDDLFPAYEIKSQEKYILTGMFLGGDQEDIVVFSDEYFDTLRREVGQELAEADTPTHLVTIQTDSSHYQQVEDRLKEFSSKHETDSYLDPKILPVYDKNTLLPDITAEFFLKEAAFTVVILILLAAGLFIFYLKYSLDTEELRDRNQFLECTGMREKDRIRLIRTEMSLHASGSLIAGLFLSAFFFVLTPVIRHFSGAQILSYSLVFLLQTALYLLLHALVMYFLERHFIREILN